MERKITYISLLNNDYRLHFLNILVIVDYKYSTTDNNMYKSYIFCQSIPFIAKKIGSRNVLDESISVPRLWSKWMNDIWKSSILVDKVGLVMKLASFLFYIFVLYFFCSYVGLDRSQNTKGIEMHTNN